MACYDKERQTATSKYDRKDRSILTSIFSKRRSVFSTCFPRSSQWPIKRLIDKAVLVPPQPWHASSDVNTRIPISIRAAATSPDKSYLSPWELAKQYTATYRLAPVSSHIFHKLHLSTPALFSLTSLHIPTYILPHLRHLLTVLFFGKARPR
jgi:hypothetical protein